MEELPDFEFFTTQLVESKKEPLVRICKGGALTFNATSSVRYNLDAGQLVIFGFDEKTRTVGIKLIDNPQDGARKLIRNGRQKVRYSQVSVYATRFLRFFNITEKGRFPLNFDEERRILYFSLGYKEDFS